MYEGLALAYELLDTSPRTSTCEQYVIVIGDGQKLDCNGDCSEGKKAYKDRAGNAYTRTARHGNGYWTCCGGDHCSPCWIPGKIKNYKDQWNEARDLGAMSDRLPSLPLSVTHFDSSLGDFSEYGGRRHP